MDNRKKKAGKKHKKQRSQPDTPTTLSTTDQQKLPPKYQNIFDKQVIGSYENDEHEKCLKECQRVLSVYPQHGETLAMKGLCMHCMADKDKKEKDEEKIENTKKEGLKLIQEGLRYNIRSSICWRVKGLAHKSDQDYEAAIVCYKRALDFDKQNSRIQTDLATLQIETGKFEDFAKQRQHLYDHNSSDTTNIVSLAIALHLAKQYDQCSDFIDEIVSSNSIKNKYKNGSPELNEIYLLKMECLFSSTKYDECIKFVDSQIIKGNILDQIRAYQRKLCALEALNQHENAIDCVQKLIDINPENVTYHKQCVSYLRLLNKSDEQIVDFLKNLQSKYPKCNAIKRLILDCCDDMKEFEKLLDEYLIFRFKKSVPSLYNDVVSLYKDERKSVILNKLVKGYKAELTKSMRFSNIENDNKLIASPMCLVWVNYFVCNHLLDLKQFDEAMRVMDETLKDVPTCIELYVMKARIYKYCGNPTMAFTTLDYARSMDKADRYLNTKCCRYALRAGKIAYAQEIVELFLNRKDENGAKDPTNKTLITLQVMWYQITKAEAHENINDADGALKELQNIYNEFETFCQNVRDFHRYSYRKCAIYSYMSLVEWYFDLRNHDFFKKAAKQAIKLCFEKSDLRKAKNWIKHLMDIDECKAYVDVVNIKYHHLDGNHEKMMECIDQCKENVTSDFVYQIYWICDRLKDNALNKLYNSEYLNSYYQTCVNEKNVDGLISVFRCCVEFGDSLTLTVKNKTSNEILIDIMELDHSPAKLIELQKNLSKQDALKKIVTEKAHELYPLQLVTS